MRLAKKSRHKFKRVKGFTLIELLVVISIIALLSTIGITVYSKASTNSKDAKMKSDIDSIAAAYENTYDPVANTYKSLDGSQFVSGSIPKQPNGGPYLFTDGPDASTPNPSSFKVCILLSDNSTYCRSAQEGQASTAYAPQVCANWPAGVTSESCKMWKGGAANGNVQSGGTVYINCSDVSAGPSALPMDCSGSDSSKSWNVSSYYTQAAGGASYSVGQVGYSCGGTQNGFWQGAHNDGCLIPVTVLLHN